ACNTATAYTYKILSSELNIPVIGVIQPGARAAIKSSINKRIGIIATSTTINSRSYENALLSINPEMVVFGKPSPELVPLIEREIVKGKELEYLIEKHLFDLKVNKQIDTLILGCTHYPLIKQPIQQYMGNGTRIVSS